MWAPLISFITAHWHFSDVFLITLIDSFGFRWIQDGVSRGRRERRHRFIQLWIGNLSNSELKCKWRPKGDDHTMYQCHLDSLSKRMSPCKRIFQFFLCGGICYFDFWSVKINLKWIWRIQAGKDGKNHSPELSLSGSGSLHNIERELFFKNNGFMLSKSVNLISCASDILQIFLFFFPSNDSGSGRISLYVGSSHVRSFNMIFLKV